MLNYKELNEKLSNFLEAQSKEALVAWLEMDRERMFFAFKSKIPQTFTYKECGVLRPRTDKNLLKFEQVFLFLYASTKKTCIQLSSNY